MTSSDAHDAPAQASGVEALIETGARAIRQARIVGITPPDEGTDYDRRLARACLESILPSATVRAGEAVAWHDLHTVPPKGKATPPAPAAVQGLRDGLKLIQRAIMEADPEVITDTVWMPGPCPETVVDFIDACLATSAEGGRS